MKVYLRILLCILLATSNDCKTNHLKDIAEHVYNVFMLGLDLSDKLKSDDNLEKIMESIDNLKEGIGNLRSILDFTKQLVEDVFHMMEVQPYFKSFNQHIEKIDSCIIDLQNVLKNQADIVCRENFQKCYNIMFNVRMIAGYASGKRSFGSNPLLDLFYNKDGSCKGEDIEKILRALVDKFTIGCIVTMAAERMKHNNSSTIYRDECWAMNKNRSTYVSSLYRKCIKLSCSSFHSRVLATLEISTELTFLQFTTLYGATTPGCSLLS